MKLISYETRDGREPGVLVNDDRNILAIRRVMPTIGTLSSLIDGGPDAIAALTRHVETAPSDALVPTSDVKIVAPIDRPKRNIFCVGKNYHEHAKEFHDSGFDASAGKDATPENPIIFSKSFTTICGPGDPINVSQDWTNSVDYEAELAVVIGTRGRGISKSSAFDHVFGYMIVNDVTSRTLQHKHKQWFLGKNFDGFCPMGPWLVTRDEVPDVETLTVSTHVNGELRQQAVVKDLIFDIPTLIETISAITTLVPGDIIATGTPAGVGIGFDPPRFLAKGDVVAVSISQLGTLENSVV